MKDFFKLGCCVFFVIGLIIVCSGIFTQQKGTQNNTDTVSGTASDALQQERKEFIDKLIQDRIFQKIDTPGTVPRVYVLPAFYTLTFNEKTSVIVVCYAYIYGLPKGDLKGFSEPIWLYNTMTNKNVGSFSATWGLDLD